MSLPEVQRLRRQCVLCDEWYPVGTYAEHAAEHRPIRKSIGGGVANKAMRERANEYRLLGMSYRQTAAIMGISFQRVHQLINGNPSKKRSREPQDFG